MPQKKNPEGLAGLDKLIAETRSKLSLTPDYLLLVALEKARAEFVGARASAQKDFLESLVISSEPEKRISQLKAAEIALDKTGVPMPAATLMEGAIAEGAIIGGDKPLMSFGSSLSKSDKFKSVRWKGEYAWWFSDRPLPASIARIRAREAAE
jgi:hypothetical protein